MKVDIPEGVKALEHSYRARVSGLKKGENDWNDARVILNLKDADGNPLPAPAPSYHGSDTDGWENFSHRFLLPEGAATLEYMPSLFNVISGVLDIDDVVLRPIDHVALQEEQARHDAPDEPAMEESDEDGWPAEIFVDGNKIKDIEVREI